MSSLFNTLNIGYSGLSAAQIGVDTTSQNITNAESEGYTRQRVVTAASTPLDTSAGNVGNGVDVTDITRIFDSYVFDRYSDVSADKEYADFTEDTLTELSTYFPEIDGVGIKSDLADYYDMWQSFSDNPDNESIKLALAQQTEVLTQNISSTQDKIVSLQKQTNDQLAVDIDEVNSLASELADINKAIDLAEAGDAYTANDLRDRRNVIELDLSRLIGAEVTSVSTESDIGLGTYETGGSYTLSVNGFNIVDGNTYHPLSVNTTGASEFYEISYERQDGTLIPMGEDITGGKIGAVLDLSGSNIEDTTSGVPTDGTLQNVVSQMDAFAAGLIESTNNLYAETSTTQMTSNYVDIDSDISLLNSGLNFQKGSFDIVIYDIDGNISGTKEITIDETTTMKGLPGSNSIQGQLESNTDDNNDGNATNDIDDFISFSWADYSSGDSALEFTMDPAKSSLGYTFAISDNLENANYDSGSNFAGALGMNKFFDGDNASNIRLSTEYSDDPSKLSAGKSQEAGDNDVALSMIQQQFEEYEFKVDDKTTYNTTIYGMFDVIATDVGVKTNAAILSNETITAQYNAIQQEYSSVSQVSIDEELTNLIKYQTAYGAASKIITTVDEMMQTLLGIK